MKEPLTPLIIKQHLNREYTIAVPLFKDNKTNYLVIEYKGEEHQRFYHLVKHLFKNVSVDEYYIYEGKDSTRLQVFIPVNQLSIEEADQQLHLYSEALKEKMTKKWKTLPSLNLPEAYNIVTIPHNQI